MATSRDDFVIAIRSAFLKKSTQQKFSLLTLFFLSVFIIILSNLNFKPIKQLRSIINEIVYRSSFIVSIPENFLKKTYIKINDYSFLYEDYLQNRDELEKLRSKNISSEIIKSENKELKNLIEDYTLTTNKILARVLSDHKSPFLKTIIINKGSSENIKIGTNIYDRNYLVGRVIEVNYKTSRVLLLSDLNSNIPVSITPGNIQAIVAGSGKDSGKIKYIKNNFIDEIKDKSIAYTSGTGSIFKSGIPVGKINIVQKDEYKNITVNFYSEFTQLKYVFAEVEFVKDITKTKGKKNKSNSSNSIKLKNTEKIKLNLLNNENEIIKESNAKFIEQNKELKDKISKLINQTFDLKKKNDYQLEIINQKQIDKKELKFLRLNLIHSHKCRKTIFNNGYKVGTPEYKRCILGKGKILE
ncbi:rod shape-determining protein MreC [Candidatus Pelagibacter sp.]|nr:rod shape-determining protein MreC [Candidatus Pelagibacter sp.]